MPELKSNKQEAFCKAVALEGMNQSDAYKIAYPTSLKWSNAIVYKKASELANNGKVKGRIEELKNTLTEKAIEKALYTAEESFNYLKDIQSRAKDKDKLSDEIKAEELKGKLAKLYIDKVELDDKRFADEVKYL